MSQHRSHSARVAVLIGWLLVGGLSGCGVATVPANGDSTTGVSTTGVSTPTDSCDPSEVISSDPWVAFDTEARDGDTLAVGDRTFLLGGISVDEVTLTGDADAVELSDASAVTSMVCGTPKSSVQWLEISAESPGTVTLTFAGGEAPVTLTVTD